MKTSDFDYELPAELIATAPAARRDASRLMVLEAVSDNPLDARFAELGRYLPSRCLLILNDTKVFPARLRGQKPTGGRVELLLLRRVESAPSGGASSSGVAPRTAGDELWEAIAGQLGDRAPRGTLLRFPGDLVAEVIAQDGAGMVRVRLIPPEGQTVAAVLERVGEIPLPPYIDAARRREGEGAVPDAPGAAAVGAAATAVDRERYQTVYATHAGAVAAPTAGLHFTRELLAALTADGHDLARVTLHVGPGTFRPVKVEDIGDHRMDGEAYDIPDETARKVEEARRSGRAIVAVGTTVVRALESAVRAGDGVVRAGPATSHLFLSPGDAFQVVTDLVTNFHLPRSTLLMLVSALAGRERILRAYADAIARGYRFYSYGDAMLIRGRR